MSKKSISALIKKYFQNQLPEDVDISFRKWFLDDYSLQEKEDALKEIWEETKGLADQSTHKELALLHHRIEASLPGRNKKYHLRRFLRIAAGFLLLLVGGLSTYLYMQSRYQAATIEWEESFVASGQQKKIVLSDSTVVWLNSGSLLVYAKEFKGKERSLYLNGEAIFDVAKDPERPFIVKTNYMEVEALGTVFNVEAYADSEYTIMTLEEGSTRVSLKDKDPLILIPDQQVRYHNITGTTTREPVDAGKVLQWKHGYINFQKATFDYIAQTLERRFDVIINYETNNFTGRSFNMKVLPDEDILQVLDILKEMIPGLRYKVSDKVIYIY